MRQLLPISSTGQGNIILKHRRRINTAKVVLGYLAGLSISGLWLLELILERRIVGTDVSNLVYSIVFGTAGS